MIASTISRRYGKAAFDLAVEANRYEEIGAELRAIAHSVETNAELRNVLFDPAMGRDAKAKILDAIGASAKLDVITLNLLRLMADRNRLADLPGLAGVFSDLADKKAGRVRATVTSAVPLSDPDLQQISQGLSRATSRNVVVEKALDPAILGGVVAQVGSMLYDGSLRTQLEDLGRTLKGQR